MSDVRDASEGSALRIITPDATAEEVAAIVAVFASLASSTPAAPSTPPAWSANHRRLRPQHPHGVGAWRASGLPR